MKIIVSNIDNISPIDNNNIEIDIELTGYQLNALLLHINTKYDVPVQTNNNKIKSLINNILHLIEDRNSIIDALPTNNEITNLSNNEYKFISERQAFKNGVFWLKQYITDKINK